jgi:hypothetical protein
LQKLKRRRNTKTIAETEQKYQIAEAEGMLKYQILQKWKTKYHSNFFFAETERKYQIAETEEKTKYQNNAETKQKYQIAEAEESKIKVQILIL